MGKKRFIIIGRRTCPFCIHACDYCEAKNLEYIFLDYETSRDILQEYKDFHKYQTVPMILSNDLESGLVRFVGGYTDLLKYEEETNGE